MKQILFFLLILLLPCCTEYDSSGEWWATVNDGIPPGQLTNVKVTNRDGEVMITYVVPPDSDVVGVKAVYRVSADREYTKYANSTLIGILLDGFLDTEEREVNLYAVDSDGNLSEPVIRPVKPLQSSVFLVRKSIQTRTTWNGLEVSWDNKNMKEMAFAFYVADETGEYLLKEMYYTNKLKDSHVFRVDSAHLDAESKSRIEVADHFSVYTEPFDTLFVPIKEMELPAFTPDGWKFDGEASSLWYYRGEYPLTPKKGSLTDLANGITMDEDDGAWLIPYTRDYVSSENPTSEAYMPAQMYMTIDMGRPALISKFKMWLQAKSPLGVQPWMSTFEVWGSNSPKPVTYQTATDWAYWTGWQEITLANGTKIPVNGTDAWTRDGSWAKIADCQYALPSGWTTAKPDLSTSDQSFLRAGVDFSMDASLPHIPYRYLRLRITKNSGGNSERQITLAEWKIFGHY